MPSRLRLRAATPADAVAVTDIRASAVPYLVQTEAGIRARLADADLAGAWLVSVEDQPAGYAMCRRPYEGNARLTIAVRPEARRAGVGTLLLETAVARAAEDAAVTVSTVADGDAALAFARAHGFAIGRPHRFSGVALAALPAPVEPPEGITVAELGSFDPYEVWQLHDLVARDDPSGMTIMQPYETWYAEDWDFPDHAPDLGVGARDGGELVAFTHVFADWVRGRIWSAMTGVRPDHRGQGLARLVKSVALHRAAGAGLTHAYTGNDAANHPMLRVNDWLGYRPVAEVWAVNRPTDG